MLLAWFLIITLNIWLWGCGAATQAPAPTPTPNPSMRQFGHVILIVEENHSYEEIIGSGSMPYLNSLAKTYGLATQYYANFHPSIPNYFMLTTGQFVTIDDAFAGTVRADNVVRELNAARKTWKAYAESLPQPGYLGEDSYPYLKRHNPFVYFSDVTQNPAQAGKIVPFTKFSADVISGQLPSFSFITPNAINDAHDGTLNEADAWLNANLVPLLSSSLFRKDGLLIITFDEGNQGDSDRGGGHVATLIISPMGKRGYKSTTFYQHASVLRLVLESLGVSNLPGAASISPRMGEFFQ